MLRVDSVEGLLGVRAPFACFIAIFGYIYMHNFATAHPRRCEFAHLCSGGVRPLYEALLWFHF